MHQKARMSAEMTRFVRRAVAAVVIVGLAIIFAYSFELILYIFAGILLALMLRPFEAVVFQSGVDGLTMTVRWKG